MLINAKGSECSSDQADSTAPNSTLKPYPSALGPKRKTLVRSFWTSQAQHILGWAKHRQKSSVPKPTLSTREDERTPISPIRLRSPISPKTLTAAEPGSSWSYTHSCCRRSCGTRAALAARAILQEAGGLNHACASCMHA